MEEEQNPLGVRYVLKRHLDLLISNYHWVHFRRRGKLKMNDIVQDRNNRHKCSGRSTILGTGTSTNPGFASRYGIPAPNIVKSNFIEAGNLKQGRSFVTRKASPVGSNFGGGLEVVTEE